MKSVKKILAITLATFLGLILVCNIYRFICTKILKKDIATVAGYAALEVISGSMEPTLHIGDMIIINTKAKDYKKGDIITFYDKNGSFVTHRIVSISDTELITKGDNNNTNDEPNVPENIIGKYVFKIGKGQKVIETLQKPLFVFLILLDGLFLSVFASIDKKGNLILDDEEKEYEEFREYIKRKKGKK